MRLRITMVVPGLPFGANTLEEKSLGGSESAGAYMARELAKRGHQVYAFTNISEAEEGHFGEAYLPMDLAATFICGNPHDICLAQRVPDLLSRTTAARLNVLWQHDLALARDSGRFRGVLWNVDKVALLSGFMADQYRSAHDLPEDVIWPTRNGVDLELVNSIPRKGPRDSKLLVYASRPERGLDVLLQDIMPLLPDYKLAITTYDNDVAHLAEFYADCRAKAAELGDRVTFLTPMNKRDLYDLYKHAGALVYPTPSPICPKFREISCITAMEAQACGLPMVTSALGALTETLDRRAGILVDGDPTKDEDYSERFAQAVSDLDEGHSKAGPLAAERFSWAALAEEWERALVSFVEERNDDPGRLVRHFIRRSDIVAAREVCRRNEVSQRLSDWIETEFAFAWNGREAFREHYAKIGATHDDVYENARHEPRLAYLIQSIQARGECVKSLLDVGCGLGVYAIEIANACPWLSVVGVDVDARTIEMAREYREWYANDPERVRFVTGDETFHFEETFDLILAAEVLEHVPAPWEFLDSIERHAAEGAEVILTVPYGPWEHMSYLTYPHRCHLWEFEMQDLRDMLGHKKRLEVQGMTSGMGSRTAEVVGWHFVTYLADDEPALPIDLDRKIRFQAPHESVTAIYMAGGPNVEDTVHWSLKSVQSFVDEIIVADCGLTDADRATFEAYGARVVPSRPPTEVGFETPRNDGLAAVDTDWALWIDTDERLLNGVQLYKYLRRNMYAGYSIRQHHFAVDAGFAPDMPVRLIRKRRYDGKEIRFFGMIHEHPETGLNEGPGAVLILPDVNIGHVGYADEATRRGRFARNAPMLERDLKKYPDRLLQKLFIMRDHQLLIDAELAQSGGRISADVLLRAKEIKRLFHEHFLGKTVYQNVDALAYYTRALEVLGEGVEVDFSLGAARDGVGQRANGPTRARFLTVEEAKTEIGHRLERQMSPLLSEHW